ncbi:uncharacterized protein LOC135479207 isoform X2 [Liolophura sinensis]
MIGIQRPTPYDMNKVEAPDHRLSLNMAAVHRRQRMLRRISSCPEEMQCQRKMDFQTCASTFLHNHYVVQRFKSKSLQNALLYHSALSREQSSLPRDHAETEQPATLMRQPILETTTDFDDTDGSVHVRRRRVERQIGCCPRKSIEWRLFRQDSGFDLNPDLDGHPLLRCRSDPSLDCSPSAEPIDCITIGLVQKLKAMFFGKDDDLRSLEKCNPIRLHMQNFTGYEPFGCDLHSYHHPDKNRWFHFLRYNVINPDDTAARQLGIEENDEILMINNEAVTRVNQRQVEMKISRTLNSGNVTLLLRRLVQDDKFEYLEIQAEVEVTEELIRVSRTRSIVYAQARGRYIVLPDQTVQCKRVNIFHRDDVVCCSGERLVTEARPHGERTFERFTVSAWDTIENKVAFFYVLKCGDKYAEAGNNCVILKPAGNGWTPERRLPKQFNSRFFRVHSTGIGPSRKIFLECADTDRQNYYVACKNGKVELIQTENPMTIRQWTALKEETVR